MDVGLPFPPRFDLVSLGDFVAELGFCAAVEAEVRLLVKERGAVRVCRNVAVEVFEGGSGGASLQFVGGGKASW